MVGSYLDYGSVLYFKGVLTMSSPHRTNPDDEWCEFCLEQDKKVRSTAIREDLKGYWHPVCEECATQIDNKLERS